MNKKIKYLHKILLTKLSNRTIKNRIATQVKRIQLFQRASISPIYKNELKKPIPDESRGRDGFNDTTKDFSPNAANGRVTFSVSQC